MLRTAPDGKRVLVMTSVESAEVPNQEHEVVFLENFFDYLRQRVQIAEMSGSRPIGNGLVGSLRYGRALFRYFF